MKTLMHRSRPVYTAALIVLLTFFSACRVTLLPSYNENVVNELIAVSKSVDKFYLEMLEKDIAEQRTYDKYVDGYISIEVELNAILNQNKARPMNKEIVANTQALVNQWVKFKENHRERNSLSDNEIKYRRSYFNDMFFTVLAGESIIPQSSTN